MQVIQCYWRFCSSPQQEGYYFMRKKISPSYISSFFLTFLFLFLFVSFSTFLKNEHEFSHSASNRHRWILLGMSSWIACVSTNTRTHVRAHAGMHTCMQAHMHTHEHTRMHAHPHTRTQTHTYTIACARIYKDDFTNLCQFSLWWRWSWCDVKNTCTFSHS